MMRWGWVLAAGCAGGTVDGSHPLDAQASGLLVMATSANDYSVGALTVLSRADPTVARDVATIHGDAVVTVDGGVVWQLNRLLADTVRRYTPGSWEAPDFEQSAGRGANPHDVALCGEQAFVSLYEQAALLVLDPEDGEVLGEVDLSAEADDDGVPEVSDLVVHDGVLYAGLQRLARLDGWSNAGGRVAAIDCDAWTVKDAWDVGNNPGLVAGPDSVWVVSEDGLAPFADGAAAAVLGDVEDALLVDVAFQADGQGAFIARDGGVHTIGCLDAAGRPTVVDRLPNYVSDVVVAEDVAWFAVRQSWEVPDTRGGLVPVALDGCAVMGPDGGIDSTFPPFGLAIVP